MASQTHRTLLLNCIDSLYCPSRDGLGETDLLALYAVANDCGATWVEALTEYLDDDDDTDFILLTHVLSEQILNANDEQIALYINLSSPASFDSDGEFVGLAMAGA